VTDSGARKRPCVQQGFLLPSFIGARDIFLSGSLTTSERDADTAPYWERGLCQVGRVADENWCADGSADQTACLAMTHQVELRLARHQRVHDRRSQRPGEL
jgi:hypothetical protein